MHWCWPSACQPVHPHARGEQRPNGAGLCCFGGSSPRTWGTGRLPSASRTSGRFIPTHVGNSPCGNAGVCNIAVHPHARGEQASTSGSARSGNGSSPRTWGTENQTDRVIQDIRFIPTHVGNRTMRSSQRIDRAVHPHARGEQTPASSRATSTAGSSPRTWGTGQCAHRSVSNGRFIPTHVGNRARMRASPLSGSGSSPRTWGTGRIRVGCDVLRRFIPTHVGNREPL